MEATKRCGRCNLIKLVCDFNNSSSTSDKKRWECKSCSVELNKKWINNNREHFNEHNRNQYVRNPQRQINKKIHERLRKFFCRGNIRHS